MDCMTGKSTRKISASADESPRRRERSVNDAEKVQPGPGSVSRLRRSFSSFKAAFSSKGSRQLSDNAKLKNTISETESSMSVDSSLEEGEDDFLRQLKQRCWRHCLKHNGYFYDWMTKESPPLSDGEVIEEQHCVSEPRLVCVCRMSTPLSNMISRLRLKPKSYQAKNGGINKTKILRLFKKKNVPVYSTSDLQMFTKDSFKDHGVAYNERTKREVDKRLREEARMRAEWEKAQATRRGSSPERDILGDEEYEDDEGRSSKDISWRDSESSPLRSPGGSPGGSPRRSPLNRHSNSLVTKRYDGNK
ncbi:uncharacterized protein [Bemisia tabaci]